jgi:uncharacterized cupin superfamily protein
LAYLFGGENLEYEIADFPKLGKRMLRRGQAIDVYELADTKPWMSRLPRSTGGLIGDTKCRPRTSGLRTG